MDEPPANLTLDADDEEARFGHLRAEPRDSMLLIAQVRRVDGREHPAKVRNLSSGGMMAECDASFARGDAIEADLRGIGWVAGKIAWSTKGRFGVAFDEAIDPKLARKPVGGAQQPQLVKTLKTMWRPGLNPR